MTADPHEVARFKAALAKLSSAEIRRRLDGSVIIRAWKRRLAEDEDGRRAQEAQAADEVSHHEAAAGRQRRKDLSWRVWALVGGAMFAAVALIWTALPH